MIIGLLSCVDYYFIFAISTACTYRTRRHWTCNMSIGVYVTLICLNFLLPANVKPPIVKILGSFALLKKEPGH